MVLSSIMVLILTIVLVVLFLGSVIYMVLVDPDNHVKTSDLSLERKAQILRGLKEKRDKRKKKDEK